MALKNEGCSDTGVISRSALTGSGRWDGLQRSRRLYDDYSDTAYTKLNFNIILYEAKPYVFIDVLIFYFL
ncbi:hypothetical protein SAMN02927921_00567 [Sinomicrobium oceani]|uniref:Uncharacterized protein n=1 Tax=Sinomicrobium oceani TaxID=1150368 RepID=A0A1K1MCL4_9FLAO|nr:hypothetical protein [Sinomicrobium oceani]SFW20890.1 hypothetical protein SAMN02927921_00567 [Sinomicrobium oceani]